MRRLLIIGFLLVAAGCGGSPAPESTATAGCADATVFAASSFAPIVADANGAGCLGEAKVSLASSTALSAQIADGAPVDVFVSAGLDAVSSLQSQGMSMGEPTTIGYNSAALMVSKRSESVDGVMSVFDVLDDALVFGACVETAPCGKLFDEVMTRVLETSGSGIASARTSLVDTEVLNAAELVTKISMGEIDLGIVYKSNCLGVAQSTSIRCVEIPEMTSDGKPLNSRVPYVVVSVSESLQAKKVYEYLTSAGFLSVLQTRFGIEAP